MMGCNITKLNGEWDKNRTDDSNNLLISKGGSHGFHPSKQQQIVGKFRKIYISTVLYKNSRLTEYKLILGYNFYEIQSRVTKL